MQKKLKKKFFFSEIMTYELVALACLYSEENTCHRQSMCQQTVLRFCISLRENFSDSTTFKVINEYGEGAAVQILTLFGPAYHVACPRVPRKRTF